MNPFFQEYSPELQTHFLAVENTNRVTDDHTGLESLIDSVRKSVPVEAGDEAYYLVIVSPSSCSLHDQSSSLRITL